MRPTLLELGARSRRPRRDRTNTFEQELPGKNFERYLGLEEIAIGIKDWHPYLILGLLQTPEYAHALISANPLLLPDQVTRLVQLRMERQQARTQAWMAPSPSSMPEFIRHPWSTSTAEA